MTEVTITMKHKLLEIAGVTALAAGLAFGQATPPHTRRAPQAGMAAFLNLTDAQKQQAQSIFSAARESAESVSTQLRQDRQALAAAVKSGATADIDRLTNAMGPLFAQSTAIRAKAMAQFYAILTPEQKDKIANRLGRMMDGMGAFQGRRPSRQ